MSPSAALTIVSAKITNALANMFRSVLIHLTLITRVKADFNWLYKLKSPVDLYVSYAYISQLKSELTAIIEPGITSARGESNR